MWTSSMAPGLLTVNSQPVSPISVNVGNSNTVAISGASSIPARSELPATSSSDIRADTER